MQRLTQISFLTVVFSCCALAGSISIAPSAQILSIGDSSTVDVTVASLTDLYAFEFDIVFNPAVLSAVNVTEGALFTGAGVSFSPGFIDNTVGTITFIGDSLSGPGPGFDGDGVLARILFTAIGGGSSNVDVANIILLDSALSDIAADSSGAVVTATQTAPEPRSLWIMSVGLGLLMLIGLGKSQFRTCWRIDGEEAPERTVRK